MKYCTNCGAQMREEELFCGQCGTAVKNQASSNYAGGSYPTGAGNDYGGYNGYNGGYGQSPYAYPYYGQKTNGLAIGGFVCGLVSIFVVGLILGILGIVLSSQALKQVATMHQKGKGLATAGVILGIIGIIGWVFAMIYLYF